MLANANPQTDALPLSRNAREIVAVCAKHDVAYGEPDNLAGFMRSLNENKHLAMNFWSIVARISDKEGAGPDWLLASIVEGVTGRTIEDVNARGPAHRLLVKKLASILAGEDVHTAIADLPIEPVRAAEPPVRQDRAVSLAEPDDVVALPPRMVAPTPSASRPHSSTSFVPNSNLTSINDGKARLVLKPESATPVNLTDEEEERRIVIPLSGYAETAPQGVVSGRMLGAALLVVLIAGLGFWFAHDRNSPMWQRFGDSINAGYTSAVAAWNGQTTPEPAPNVQAVNAPATSNGAAVQPPASLTTSQSPNQQTTPSPKLPAKPTAFAPPAPQPQRNRSVESPTRSRVPEADSSETVEPSDSNPTETEPRVVVPETIMQPNLISSRVPVYPEVAKAAHIQGLVVLQAVVDADGSVGHLRVVSGDPALRRAALDAVSNWRYRPYVQNGQPVDVSTTISIAFSQGE